MRLVVLDSPVHYAVTGLVLDQSLDCPHGGEVFNLNKLLMSFPVTTSPYSWRRDCVERPVGHYTNVLEVF